MMLAPYSQSPLSLVGSQDAGQVQLLRVVDNESQSFANEAQASLARRHLTAELALCHGDILRKNLKVGLEKVAVDRDKVERSKHFFHNK